MGRQNVFTEIPGLERSSKPCSMRNNTNKSIPAQERFFPCVGPNFDWAALRYVSDCKQKCFTGIFYMYPQSGAKPFVKITLKILISVVRFFLVGLIILTRLIESKQLFW